jgi:glycosyltransferase involved in cell wall biosynthesis
MCQKASNLRREIAELHLSGSVMPIGAVAEPDLPALYSAARLYVFPSLFEGFGLPILEAMACGTPVVSSNATSLPEVAGDAACLVDPLDEDQLAEAMYRALTDEPLHASLRKRGLERAREFSWERTARGTVDVYRRVLSAEH